MSTHRLATRYAKSLLERGIANNTLTVISADVETIESALSASREFKALTKNPIVKTEKKLSIFDALFADKISVDTKDFLHLVIEKKREAYLSEILTSFKTQVSDLNEVSEITITTAVALEQESLVKIASEVKESLHLKNVKVKVDVDARIMGGFIVKLGDRVYDDSVAYKLQKLKRELILN